MSDQVGFSPTVNFGDLGQLIEGTVKKVAGGRFVIVTVDHEGNDVIVDPQEALARYENKEVRFTLASFEGLQQLQEMVEKASGTDVEVESVTPRDLQRQFRGDPTS